MNGIELLNDIKKLRDSWKDARTSHYRHYLATSKIDKRAESYANVLDAVIKEIDAVIKKYV